MKSSPNCTSLIMQFEGCSLVPYLDSVNIPTIGYGSTHYSDNTPVTMQDTPITKEEAEDLLEDHLNKIAARIDGYIEVDLHQNQTDAILSLSYNIGEKNFRDSTLLKILNTGDINRAAEQFTVWNKAGGKTLEGLVRRREAEKALFLS